MSIFSNIQTYPSGWTVVKTEKISEEDKHQIRKATVVQSTYGLSARLDLIDGKVGFIPLSNDSVGSIDQEINLDSCLLLELAKEGKMNITRLKVM